MRACVCVEINQIQGGKGIEIIAIVRVRDRVGENKESKQPKAFLSSHHNLRREKEREKIDHRR